MPLWGVALSALLLASRAAGAGDRIEFGRDILPLLSDNCFHCHGPDAAHRKADLRLDDEAAAKELRAGSAAIFPGDSGRSELIRRIATKDPDEVMPPPGSNKELSPEQIALLTRWIDEGAEWGDHWAFAPLKKPVPPPAARSNYPARNAIDLFIQARLEREGLHPSPEADRRTLMRRASLDLTGLPPTAEEVEHFAADHSAEAYERMVERLLSSPRYGERMAWDWMEAARYADSNGYQGDGERTMWPWRDWVVKAFNDNMPYDEFTVWQLAGDLLPGATLEQKLATGFLRNHPINGEGGRIPEENRIEYVMDMAETTGTVWLGLTFNCARCHDHRFDPISHEDYFSLFAFFNQTPVTGGGGNPQTPPVVDASSPEQHARVAEAERAFKERAAELELVEKEVFPREEGLKAGESEAVAEVGQQIRDFLNREPAARDLFQLDMIEREFRTRKPDYAEAVRVLTEARKYRDAVNREVVRVMVMEEMEKPRETFILRGGFYDKPGDKVSARTPSQLPPMREDEPRNRLGLARWLVSPENQLTARVTVNRFWQMFFGAGLVKTSEDFGVQGQFPAHPELLDWLAVEFMESGWDVKKLVKLIVTSHAYRQSSKASLETRERDPENRLLARGPRYRMPSWMIRDQALAASGLLSGQVGGAPVKPYQPDGVWEEATFGEKKYRRDEGEALYRRSLYVFWRRIVGPTLFFDTPSRMVCTVKPSRNNTPLHALSTLNDTTYVEAARALAERVMLTAEASPERAKLIFEEVLGRPPGPEELAALWSGQERALEEFKRHPEEAKALLAVGDAPRRESFGAAEHAAWTAVALAVLNSDEALTKE